MNKLLKRMLGITMVCVPVLALFGAMGYGMYQDGILGLVSCILGAVSSVFIGIVICEG